MSGRKIERILQILAWWLALALALGAISSGLYSLVYDDSLSLRPLEVAIYGPFWGLWLGLVFISRRSPRRKASDFTHAATGGCWIATVFAFLPAGELAVRGFSLPSWPFEFVAGTAICYVIIIPAGDWLWSLVVGSSCKEEWATGR